MRQTRSQQVHGAAALLLIPLLALLTGGSPATAAHELRSPGPSMDPFAPVLAAVGLLAWLCTAWLLLVVVADLGTRLPGVLGRASTRVLNRLAPRPVRALVRGATGLALAGSLLGGMTGTAAAATSPSPGPLRATTAAPAVPAPPAPITADPLDWPTTTPMTSTVAPPDPTTRTDPPPTMATSPRPATPPTTPTRARPYVVAPGDSLWTIAAHHLAPSGTGTSAARVADAWPRWWQANRVAIGADPDLLIPGTALQPPTAPQTPTVP